MEKEIEKLNQERKENQAELARAAHNEGILASLYEKDFINKDDNLTMSL